MAEYVCKIQMLLSHMDKFPTPQPLNGMEKKKTASLNALDYLFEDDKGNFVEMLFDINDNGEHVFVFVKMVATTDEIMADYIKPYIDIEKEFPMKMEDFYYMDRTIVVKQVLKERNQRLVDFFSKNRKGVYFGNFVDVKR